MTIGRTDDPENPISVPAFEAAKLFGTGSRTHLGQRTWCRVNRPDTCSHSTRPSEFSSRLLHPRGRPHMHAETHTIGNSVSDHPTNTARQLAFSLVRRPITPLRIGRI